MRGGALGAFGKSVVKGVLYSFTHIYFNSPSCDLARPPSRQHQHILPYRNVPQGSPIRACQGCVLPRNTSSRPNASPVPDVPGPNAYNIPQGRFSQPRPAIQTQNVFYQNRCWTTISEVHSSRKPTGLQRKNHLFSQAGVFQNP